MDRYRVLQPARQHFLGLRLKVLLDGQELVSLALRLMELLGVSYRVEVKYLGTHVCGNGSPAEDRTDQAVDDRCIGVRRSALLDAESESFLVGYTVADPTQTNDHVKEVECKYEHVLKLVLVLADISVAVADKCAYQATYCVLIEGLNWRLL